MGNITFYNMADWYTVGALIGCLSLRCLDSNAAACRLSMRNNIPAAVIGENRKSVERCQQGSNVLTTLIVPQQLLLIQHQAGY